MRTQWERDFICQAIRDRRLLEVVYHGHTRVVAPHIFGLDTTDTEVLSCYQISGGAQGGEQKGWKSLKARELSVTRITELRFHPRPEYRPNDRAMVTVYCRV